MRGHPAFSPGRIPPAGSRGRMPAGTTNDRGGRTVKKLSSFRRRAGARRAPFVGVVAVLAVTAAALAGTGASAQKQSQVRVSPLSASTLVAQAVRSGQLVPTAGAAFRGAAGVDTTILPNVK